MSSIACPLLAVADHHGVAVFDVMRSEELSLLVGQAGLVRVLLEVTCD